MDLFSHNIAGLIDGTGHPNGAGVLGVSWRLLDTSPLPG